MVAAARVPGPADRIWRHCNASTTGVVNPGRGPASFRDSMGCNSLYGMGRWRPRVALVLAGCAVGPDCERPEVALPEAWPGAVGEQMDQNSADAEFWWERFEDPQLDRLVRDALENDLDAGIAAARVVQARAEWLPSLNLAALFGQEASGWRHASARCVPGSRSLTWRSGAILAASWAIWRCWTRVAPCWMRGLTLTEASRDRLAATATLFRALGGGWDSAAIPSDVLEDGDPDDAKEEAVTPADPDD